VRQPGGRIAEEGKDEGKEDPGTSRHGGYRIWAESEFEAWEGEGEALALAGNRGPRRKPKGFARAFLYGSMEEMVKSMWDSKASMSGSKPKRQKKGGKSLATGKPQQGEKNFSPVRMCPKTILSRKVLGGDSQFRGTLRVRGLISEGDKGMRL